MKVTKYILSSLVAAALALSVTSCKESFLDTMPDNRVELQTVDQLRMLLNTGYPSMSYMLPCELSTDNLEDNNSPDSKGTRYNLPSYCNGDDELFAWEEVRTESGEDTPSAIWEGYWSSVAAANAVLDAAEKMRNNGYNADDARLLPAVVAEAKMIRAFAIWTLAEIFCEQYRGPELSKDLLGLPYPTKPETTVKPHYERGNLADLYDKIEKDINEALPEIDNTLYEVPKYHFNKQAANAFAARFYLHKRDYKKVLEHCNAVFGGAEVDPSPYMSDIWSKFDLFYYISDFGKYYNNISQARNFLLIPTYSAAVRHLYGGVRYGCMRNAKRGAYQGPGPTWTGFKWTSRDKKEGSFSMHPAFNSYYPNGKAEYGILMPWNTAEQFEYTDKNAGIGYAHLTISEFNGEETIFMRAEAKLFLGDKQGAIDDLKVWELSLRNCPGAVGHEDNFNDLTEESIRRFYTGSDAAKFEINKPIHIDEVCPSEYSLNDDIEPILQCVQHFRRIFSLQTGMRWFDIKRYGLEITHKIGRARVEKLTVFDKRKALQIPFEALSAGFEPSPRENPVMPPIEHAIPVEN